MGTVAKLVISLDANTGEYVAKIKEAEQKTSGFTDKLKGIGTAAAGFVAGGALIMGLQTAGGALIDTTQKAANFETTLNRFSAVSGVGGQTLEAFSQLALKMGAQTQFSAGEAAQAMVELVKGGIDPAAIQAGTLEQTLGLAAAGELNLATAAEITAKQLGVWASTGTSAADVANLMAQAANASTVDVDELALGMANVGGVAKVAGLSFEETTQTMALLAPGFSSAADAGTSLKAFLNNMIPTTSNAKTAMFDLGLTTENVDKKLAVLAANGIDASKFDTTQINDSLVKVGAQLGYTEKETVEWIDSMVTNKFYDAKGNFVGMEEASRLLQTATQDLSEAEKSLALETIFGSDAQRAAALIAEQGAEGYNKMGVAMDTAGSATDQAAAKNKGLNFALESFKGSLETIAIIIGTKFLPVATQIINDFLIPAVNQVVENWPQISATIDQVFQFIVATWNDPVGPVFTALLTIVKDIVTWVVENWPQIKAAVEPVLQGIVNFIKDPLLPSIKAIIDAGIAVVKWFSDPEGFPKFKTTVEETVNGVIEFFTKIPEKFVAFGKAIIDGLVAGVNSNLASFKNALFAWLPQWAKDALGIQSPSKLFAYYGEMSALGYMQGFSNAFSTPQLTGPVMQYAFGRGGQGGALAGAGMGGPLTINFNGDIHVRSRGDIDALADAIFERARYRS